MAIFGLPKEIKIKENRVGLIPSTVRELTRLGHTVLVQSHCGVNIGLTNEDYQSAGATIVDTPEAIFAKSDVIVKVKEPLENECKMLKPNQLLITYLHLAADKHQTELLLKSGASAIAYETVTDDKGGLPMLSPMSAIAGRLSIQVASRCLEMAQGGKGILLGGMPGVERGHVVVIGGGVVGTHAIQMAVGMNAKVTVIERSVQRMGELEDLFRGKIDTLMSNTNNIEKAIKTADIVVGAVLIPGASAPKVLTRDMLRVMPKNSVFVDVAIDQGGCSETSKPTTHENPTYIDEGVIHYCVTNMPGTVARTSAFALNYSTFPLIMSIAQKGLNETMKHKHFRNGLNIHKGFITYESVAKNFPDLAYKDIHSFF